MWLRSLLTDHDRNGPRDRVAVRSCGGVGGGNVLQDTGPQLSEGGGDLDQRARPKGALRKAMDR